MKNRKKILLELSSTILSLSLLTVMAGAAVAPALDVIEKNFSDTNKLLVQMIISVPAIFIVITNMFFPAMCKKLGSRTLVLIGLFLYTIGGCSAGMFNNIYAVLAARAFVGIGVGIVMPMSTGLIAYYFSKSKQGKMMGYSSAMNQMGGVIATLLSGILATVSWRASFLVYLLGLVSIILCAVFLPNRKIHSAEVKVSEGNFKRYYQYIVAMFLLMLTFFIYPSSFAMETIRIGVIPQKFITVIMASMDLIAFFGGLVFAKIGMRKKDYTKLLAPSMFLIGFILLIFPGGWTGSIVGSLLIGFANGFGIPLIITTASQKAGKNAAVTVLPLISASLYTAQFLTPVILSGADIFFAKFQLTHVPYLIAIISSLLLLIWSTVVKTNKERNPETCGITSN